MKSSSDDLHAKMSLRFQAVSSGFKREAIPIKNHDAQSLICWIHVLVLGASGALAAASEHKSDMGPSSSQKILPPKAKERHAF